jgi:hypothetical protein
MGQTAFYFPINGPENGMRSDVTALQQLDHYLPLKVLGEHNPSITVYVREMNGSK